MINNSKYGGPYRQGYFIAYHCTLPASSNPYSVFNFFNHRAWLQGWRAGASVKINGRRSMFQRAIERGLRK